MTNKTSKMILISYTKETISTSYSHSIGYLLHDAKQTVMFF